MNPFDHHLEPPAPPAAEQIRLPGIPAPVSTQLAGPVRTPEGELLCLIVHSANGTFGFYLDAGHARHLAQGLLDRATQLETGLVLPPSSGLVSA